MNLRILLGLSPVLCLAACNLAPKYVQPAAPVPPALPQGGAYPTLASGEPTADALGWREFFTDPRLQQVIAKALADNRNLRATLANVERARALYRVNRAALFPIVNGSATLSAVQGTQGRITDNFLVQAGSSSYEIDLRAACAISAPLPSRLGPQPKRAASPPRSRSLLKRPAHGSPMPPRLTACASRRKPSPRARTR